MLRALCGRGSTTTIRNWALANVGGTPANTNAVSALVVRQTATAANEAPPDSHSKHYLYERYVAAAMYGIFPAALFVHNPAMDYTLAVVLALHMHWGLHTVVTDYARPFVVGDTLAKLASLSIYLLSIATFVGLLNFNFNDVGITRAFEILFAM